MRRLEQKELIMWWPNTIISPEIEGRKAGEKLARKLKLIWKDCTADEEE